MQDLQAYVRVDHATDMEHAALESRPQLDALESRSQLDALESRPLLDALASRTTSNASQASAQPASRAAVPCGTCGGEKGGSVAGRELGVKLDEGMRKNLVVPFLAVSPVPGLDLSTVDEAPRTSGLSFASFCSLSVRAMADWVLVL